MNREALPLIIGILVPIVFVAILVLYLYGHDFFVSYLWNVPVIYYIVLIPFGLVGVVAVYWLRREQD